MECAVMLWREGPKPAVLVVCVTLGGGAHEAFGNGELISSPHDAEKVLVISYIINYLFMMFSPFLRGVWPEGNIVQGISLCSHFTEHVGL